MDQISNFCLSSTHLFMPNSVAVLLLYGLETCLLKKSDFRSLDFIIDRFFMKLSEQPTWILSGYVRNILTLNY